MGSRPPNIDSGNTNGMMRGLVFSTIFYPIMSVLVIAVTGLLVTTLVVVKMRKPKQRAVHNALAMVQHSLSQAGTNIQ